MAAAWRALPATGRLLLTAEFNPKPEPKLLIAEVRCVPTRLVLPDWDADELALSIWLRSIRIRPPECRETTTFLAVVGLHALARRFERGERRADAAVLRDLAPVGRGYPAAVAAGVEFAIPAGTGRWIGAVMQASGAPVLAVRTFLDG